MTIFDGKKLALQKEKILQKRVNKLVSKIGFRPTLVSVLIGENPASLKYLQIKKTVGERIGFRVVVKKFPASISEVVVYQSLEKATQDQKVWGVMIQMPLPEKWLMVNDQWSMVNKIDSGKDIDCLTSENLELLGKGQPRFLPATLRGILSILKSAKISLGGKKVVVVGAKGFVGQTLVSYLPHLGAKVMGLDLETKDLGAKTRRAEILISATGVPGLVKKEMVKKGAVVVDVGSPKGDVCFAEVKKVASFLTPVPGGVGPMTVVSLFENLLETR